MKTSNEEQVKVEKEREMLKRQNFELFEKRLTALVQMPGGAKLANELHMLGRQVRATGETIEVHIKERSFISDMFMGRGKKALYTHCNLLYIDLQSRHDDIVKRKDIPNETGAIYASGLRILQELLKIWMDDIQSTRISRLF